MSERRNNSSDDSDSPSSRYDRGDFQQRQRPYDPGKEDDYQKEIEKTEKEDDD